MGFLDRAKKLAEQAKAVAEQAREVAEEALQDARARSGTSGGQPSGEAAPAPTAIDPTIDTSYVPGMLGRPGWEERGLTDPAAVLPIADRDRAGVPAGGARDEGDRRLRSLGPGSRSRCPAGRRLSSSGGPIRADRRRRTSGI